MKYNSIRSRLLASSLAAALFAGPALAQNQNLSGNLIVHSVSANNTASYATTINSKAGVVTTENALNNPGGIYTETITNNQVAVGDICMAKVSTTGTGSPVVGDIAEAAGSLVIQVKNVHPTASFNGPLLIKFICYKP